MPAFPTSRPQPQAAPLNEAGQQSLVLLVQNDTASKRLHTRQRKAAEILQTVVGNVNDRAHHARLRHGNKLRRLEAEGEEEPEEELNEYNKYQDQVTESTERLEVELRGIIDDIDWLATVPDVLKAVALSTGAATEETQRTQTQNTIPMTTQRSRRTIGDGEGEAEESENDAEEPASTQLDPSDAPTALLENAFRERASVWNAKTLTEKYAETNEYTGFYRTIHDSKYPGGEVPVPHNSIWFAAEEGRLMEDRANSATDNDEDADDDIAVDRVVVRTTCPFTLRLFKDPVTSKKCPHSFEKTAFYTVLNQTDKHLPFTPEQLGDLSRCRNRTERMKKEKEIGTPAVQCPECSRLLAEVDVAPDPTLRRKVERMEAEKERGRQAEDDSEEEEDDEDVPRGTQRKPVGLGSSPPSRRASGRAASIKAENGHVVLLSRPSGTQTTAEEATVMDLRDDDDDEDMENE